MATSGGQKDQQMPGPACPKPSKRCEYSQQVAMLTQDCGSKPLGKRFVPQDCFADPSQC